jgi:hypothetical protein
VYNENDGSKRRKKRPTVVVAVIQYQMPEGPALKDLKQMKSLALLLTDVPGPREPGCVAAKGRDLPQGHCSWEVRRLTISAFEFDSQHLHLKRRWLPSFLRLLPLGFGRWIRCHRWLFGGAYR